MMRKLSIYESLRTWFADDPALTPSDHKAIRLDTRRVSNGQTVSFDMVDEGGAVAIFSSAL